MREIGLPALAMSVSLLLLEKNVDGDFPWTYEGIIIICSWLKHYTN